MQGMATQTSLSSCCRPSGALEAVAMLLQIKTVGRGIHLRAFQLEEGDGQRVPLLVFSTRGKQTSRCGQKALLDRPDQSPPPFCDLRAK
jgi:hypothetical protein